MKISKLLILILFPLWGLGGFAQEKLSKEEKARREKNIQAGNPFAKYGNKAPVATLSKGKYLEVHDLDTIVIIGTMRWHVDNKKIVGRIIIDSLNVDAQPIGDRVGRWMSPDPLSEEFPSWSPYNYVYNNPLSFVDIDGLYPRPLLIYDSKIGLYGGYKFTESATHLLHKVSGVNKGMIANVVVQERNIGQYRPFYSSDTGGGAITLGADSFNANITYTENWFEDDKTKYNGHGYGQDIESWLSLSAHEVGHLPQIDKEGGFLGYIIEMGDQYISSGSHDGADYEKEADKGFEVFTKFNDFVNKKYGENTLIKMFEANEKDDGRKGTENYKIEQIDKYWKEYENQ